MNRRNFLKTSALISAGSAFAGDGLIHPVSPEFQAIQPPKNSVAILENEFLKYEIFTDASTVITDKINQFQWRQGPVAIQDSGEIEENNCWFRGERTFMEQYPGRFQVTREGEQFRFTLLARQNRVVGRFLCCIQPEREWLCFQLLEIDESIPSLIFPTPVFSDASVIPHGAGRLVQSSAPDIWKREFLPFYTHLNMQMLGGLKAGMAWIGIFGPNSTDAGAFLYNGLVSPVWLKSLGRWQGDYQFRLRFFKGDYNEIAQVYRDWLQKNQRWVTLREKAEQNLRVKALPGGRILSYFQAFPALNRTAAEDYIFSPDQMKAERQQMEIRFTHHELKKSLEYAKSQGFSKGLINIRGWINGGYDFSHPDIWPPEPELGEYRQLAELMRAKQSFPFCLHDNYQDMYDHTASFPKGVLQRPDGSLIHGGLWAGGQAYMLNSRDSLAFAKRNWEKIRELHPDAMFPDTITAARLLQSFENGNTLTRLQDREFKTEILKFYREQGLLVGCEEGADFGVPDCDWFENRHRRIPGETIPLWSLVFHDAAFCARYTTFTDDTPYPKWLEDLLWGYMLLFQMQPDFGKITTRKTSAETGFSPAPMNEQLFTSTFQVDRWHAQIGMQQMLSHRFVTEDKQVEETIFENGHRIIVNFDANDREIEGTLIKGHHHWISNL